MKMLVDKSLISDKSVLVVLVIKEMIRDIEMGDVTGIEELLHKLDIDSLRDYIPETKLVSVDLEEE